MTDKDDDSRLGAYAPPTDEFDTFDARDDDARRGPLLLTMAVFVFILFFGVVWSAYKQGVRERDDAPRIVADSEPFRERPADPGGVETPDTDLDVYNRLTGDSEEGVDDVSLRPAPEEPIEDSRPSLRVETVAADRVDEPDTQTVERSTLPDITPRQAPARPQRQDTGPESRDEPSSSDPAGDSLSSDEVVPPAVNRADPPAQTPAGPVADPSGAWVVQIASFRTEADAEAAWLAFSARFSDLAGGLAPDIASVDIADRGTYHRLRIAAFATRDDASAFCSQLQSRGQDCLVARR